MQPKHFDTIVIGSGVAGLSFLHYYKKAQEAADSSKTGASSNKKLSIALFVKSDVSNTNTSWAQGGIAAVDTSTIPSTDSFEAHISDTMIAGGHTNNESIVRKVVEQGPSLMQELQKMGMPFDTNNHKQIDLAQEGGHSQARIWHVKDYTGKALQQTLQNNTVDEPSVYLQEHVFVLGIKKVSDHLFEVDTCHLKTKTFTTYTTHFVVLATGGVGQLYAQTTNTDVATGDGIYLAHSLGARIQDLSFIQFHPTGLYSKSASIYLITEALRGAGAVLRNHAGDNFMLRYDKRGSLAPRDIVSRAIVSEMQNENAPHLYLDATGIDPKIFDSHFPSIKASIKELVGIDMATDYIPIIPTQHYSCGGIAVNEYGESTVAQLYAIGECASTGLHGANRLASNSLLEGLAFAQFAADKIVDIFKQQIFTEQLYQNQTNNQYNYPVLKLDRAAIQNIVSNYAGVIKTTEGLLEGRLAITDLIENAPVLDYFSLEDFETTCMATTALLLLDNAILQTRNVGVFYNASIA
jgi:L-aspartate oxidase